MTPRGIKVKNSSLTTDLENVLFTVKNNIIELLPNLINAFIILACGILMAYVFKWLSKKIARWVVQLLPKTIRHKDIVRREFSSFVLGIGRLFFFLTLLFAISFSLQEVGLTIVTGWLHHLGTYIPSILSSLLIVILGWKVKTILEKTLNEALIKTGIENAFFYSKMIAWLIFIITALLASQQLGLDISLIIILGSVVVGVLTLGLALMFSLGAKDSVSDILYCYQIGKIIKVGNVIEINNVRGVVKSIGPVFVLIETSTGTMTIPGKIISNEVIVFSKKGEV
jgi:hypothetical protein